MLRKDLTQGICPAHKKQVTRSFLRWGKQLFLVAPHVLWISVELAEKPTTSPPATGRCCRLESLESLERGSCVSTDDGIGGASIVPFCSQTRTSFLQVCGKKKNRCDVPRLCTPCISGHFSGVPEVEVQSPLLPSQGVTNRIRTHTSKVNCPPPRRSFIRPPPPRQAVLFCHVKASV